MKQPIKRIFAAAVAGTTLELLVYDEIGENYWTGGGVTAQGVANAIENAGAFDRIAVRVNSPGGDCFEGVAIYNLIRSQGKPVDVFVDGLAASAASVIAMSGDTVSVGVGAMLMIHNAATFAYGDGPAFLKIADTLDKISQTVGSIYVAKTKQTADQVKALMDAETWMGAQEAIDNGFADAIMNQDEETTTQARALCKSFNLRGYKRVPAQLQHQSLRKPAKPRASADDCECDCPPCQAGNCPDCETDPCEAVGCTCPNHDSSVGSKAPDAFDDVARQRLALYERS
jgi:ATP-dependent protease ClpP protease subunit